MNGVRLGEKGRFLVADRRLQPAATRTRPAESPSRRSPRRRVGGRDPQVYEPPAPAATEWFRRSAGIILHPSSLPGPHGIGAFGREAFEFADFLDSAGQRLWQTLPLGPTGY